MATAQKAGRRKRTGSAIGVRLGEDVRQRLAAVLPKLPYQPSIQRFAQAAIVRALDEEEARLKGGGR